MQELGVVATMEHITHERLFRRRWWWQSLASQDGRNVSTYANICARLPSTSRAAPRLGTGHCSPASVAAPFPTVLQV